MRQCCLPKPGRAVKEHMFKCFAALLGCQDLDVQIVFHPLLTDQIVQCGRSQSQVYVVFRSFGCKDAVFVFGYHRQNYNR